MNRLTKNLQRFGSFIFEFFLDISNINCCHHYRNVEQITVNWCIDYIIVDKPDRAFLIRVH